MPSPARRAALAALLAAVAAPPCTRGLDEWHLDRRRAQKVLVVHVGKTGGSSASSYLKRNGVPLHRVHRRPITRAEINAARAVIVPVRDPLARAVSGFNWRHTHQFPPTRFEREELFKCFSHPNELALALLPPRGDSGEGARGHATVDVSEHCRGVARRGLHPGVAEANQTQMGMGWAYHVGDTISLLESAKGVHVYAVHTDSLQGDAMDMYKALLRDRTLGLQAGRGHGARHAAAHAAEFPTTHTGRYNGSERVVTDARAREAMRAELVEDYAIIARVERLHARTIARGASECSR